jgi:hypothetical protein
MNRTADGVSSSSVMLKLRARAQQRCLLELESVGQCLPW